MAMPFSNTKITFLDLRRQANFARCWFIEKVYCIQKTMPAYANCHVQLGGDGAGMKNLFTFLTASPIAGSMSTGPIYNLSF